MIPIYYHLILYRRNCFSDSMAISIKCKMTNVKANTSENHYSLYLVFVRTEQFSEHVSRTIRGPKRLGQHSNLIHVCRQNSGTRSAVFTISTVAR